MCFGYSITHMHVTKVELQIADALSRSSVSSPSDEDNDFENKTTAYVHMLVQSLPETDKTLQEILTTQDTNSTC